MKMQRNVLSDDFLVATEVLAENLSYSEPIVAYQNACDHLDADHRARALLQDLANAQSEIRSRQAKGPVSQADVDRLRALQNEVLSNQIISQYALAQQVAIAYLKEINHEISQLLGIDFAALSRPTGGSC
jgi:cell fate (sporulation/competence/biofilm development) regulator YlbF (YheA/YmcA/DUF963 family)